MCLMLVLMFVISSSFELNVIGIDIVHYNLSHLCVDYIGLTKINFT